MMIFSFDKKFPYIQLSLTFILCLHMNEVKNNWIPECNVVVSYPISDTLLACVWWVWVQRGQIVQLHGSLFWGWEVGRQEIWGFFKKVKQLVTETRTSQYLNLWAMKKCLLYLGLCVRWMIYRRLILPP